MLKTRLAKGEGGLQSILCLGAHCDDIEIGCGGSILKLLEEHAGTSVSWIVFSANDAREREARESAEVFLKSAAGQVILVKRFRDGFFPASMSEIKEFFEELKQDISPNLIFSHYGQDLHQDHRIISELTWNTFRDHMILEYEIPKYDGGLGSPNLFVTLEDRHLQLKVQTLMERFTSQRRHLWFSPETFNGLARLRGIECNAPSGFAEAFYCRKAVL